MTTTTVSAPAVAAAGTVEVTDVTRVFGSTRALDGLDLVLPAGRITALLGRNGAGKSTLLSLLAGRRAPTTGRVRVAGGDPFRDPRSLEQVCLVGDGGGESDTDRVRQRVSLAARLRRSFDRDLAMDLLASLEVDSASRIKELSKGKRAAVGVALGLAARTPVTLFDESHLGMDVQGRYAFYHALVTEALDHPRTIVLSTHHVDEVSRVIEDVAVIDRGRVILHESRDDLLARSAVLTGRADDVGSVLGDVEPLHVRTLGSTCEAIVFDDEVPAIRARARVGQVDTASLGLQDLFVHLTTTITGRRSR